ncbi:MAG TPA: aldo/keto reductase [Kofleriaceae bacterium]|nr:aldo/keto reductase [Kofleriaceae bacterium]
MRTRRFGPLDVEIPVLGLGTWNLEQDDRAQAIATLRRGIELGMVHIDTAEMYGDGQAEEIVGAAIAGWRERLFLVSKVLPQHARAAACKRACEASLRRLGTDHLDLYLLHWRGAVPLAETIGAFEALAAEGKIRAWGVSNFDDADLDEVWRIAPGKVACNQVLYHLLDRTIEHRVIPWCEQHRVAVVAYSPFGSGDGFPQSAALDAVAARLGATPRQVALAYLTRRPSVFAIPKTGRVAHAEEIAGADRVTLDAAALAALDAAFPLAPWRGLPMI